MNIFEYFEDEFSKIFHSLVQRFSLPSTIDLSRVVFEAPREIAHGDVATNAALILSKPMQKKPLDIAEILAAEFIKLEEVISVDVAGPGFINLWVEPSIWSRQIPEVLCAGKDYGRSSMGCGERVNVEFVSANPTGPLHAAHARGAVIGDALAGLMEFCGRLWHADPGAVKRKNKNKNNDDKIKNHTNNKS